jgi:hypothetical protein
LLYGCLYGATPVAVAIHDRRGVEVERFTLEQAGARVTVNRRARPRGLPLRSALAGAVRELEGGEVVPAAARPPRRRRSARRRRHPGHRARVAFSYDGGGEA